MLTLGQTLRYYKRPEIQAAIVEAGRNKEIGVRFNETFGARPDALRYPNDVFDMVRAGATSFHASEELWSNPLALSTSMRREELDRLRIGWDLIIDIDCKIFEYSRIAAKLVVEFLMHYGLGSVSIKFSGNKGFHIGVPFEAFPGKLGNKQTSSLFPEVANKICAFAWENIKSPLNEAILDYEHRSFAAILEKTGKSEKEIRMDVKSAKASDGFEQKVPVLNVLPFLNLDAVLISSRHLYRMPYSLHEKSGFVSVPIDPGMIAGFERSDAAPEKVKVSAYTFLDRARARPGDAANLMLQALDSCAKLDEAGPVSEKPFEMPQGLVVNESHFPPCIKKILAGLEDGRKRALFVLINFFSSLGWEYDLIDKKVYEWNQKNKEPLRESYVKSQLTYNRQRKRRAMPPNCSNTAYYKDLGVHEPDSVCSRIRNPVNYVVRRARYAQEQAPKPLKAQVKPSKRPSRKKEAKGAAKSLDKEGS